MIRVRVERDGQRTTALSVSGHAGMAPKGQDVVCAAASALTETLQLALTRMAAAGWRGRVVSGRAVFGFDAGLEAPARAVVDAVVWGLQDLAASYPAFVHYREVAAGSGAARRERGEQDAAAIVRAQKGGR